MAACCADGCLCTFGPNRFLLELELIVLQASRRELLCKLARLHAPQSRVFCSVPRTQARGSPHPSQAPSSPILAPKTSPCNSDMSYCQKSSISKDLRARKTCWERVSGEGVRFVHLAR